MLTGSIVEDERVKKMSRRVAVGDRCVPWKQRLRRLRVSRAGTATLRNTKPKMGHTKTQRAETCPRARLLGWA